MKKVFIRCALALILVTGLLPVFSLSPAAVAASLDSVVVTPASPTTRDSIAFSLFGANLGCGGTVHNDTVIVGDTCIYLSFSYEECLACDCISMGQWIPFHSKPLNTGTYGIYKMQNYYCPPGSACPAIATVPVHVGQVTVHTTTAVRSIANAFTPAPQFSWAVRNGAVAIRYAQPDAREVCAAIYDARGSLLQRISMVEGATGHYFTTWKQGTAQSGTYVVRILSDGTNVFTNRITITR